MAAAEAALAGGHWESAISRAYYAVYHLVVEVLAAKRGIEAGRRPHDSLANLFQAEFCRSGFLFSARDGKDLQQLLEDRHDADYHEVSLNRVKTERVLQQAKRLYQKLLGELGKNA